MLIDLLPHYLNTGRLHALLEKKELTCRALFKQASVDIAKLERWESGTLTISKNELSRLALALDVPPENLTMFHVADIEKLEKEFNARKNEIISETESSAMLGARFVLPKPLRRADDPA